MRFVEITVPTGKRNAILSALDDDGIDYVVMDETSGRKVTAVVAFPLPTEAVEPVLDRLREAGLPEDAYTIVLDAETVVSRRFGDLEARYEAGEEGVTELEHEAIAREELRANAEELATSGLKFFTLTVTSAVIATAGILLDSALIVVGANVIVPLMDPAMAASVGTVLRERDLYERGVKLQTVGLVLAVASAALFALFVRLTNLAPLGTGLFALDQLQEGMTANFLSLAVALGAGIAGAVSLTTGVSSAIVGVMIAVALIPPAATLGIGIAWADPVIAIDAGMLLLVNVLSINFAALVVFWSIGYRPRGVIRAGAARTQTLKRVGVLFVALLVLSAFLGGVTYSSLQQAEFERTANTAVEDVLTRPVYDDLLLISVDVSYERGVIFREPTHVVVTVGRPAEASVSGLDDAVADRLAVRTDARLVVQVRSVQVDQTRVRGS